MTESLQEEERKEISEDFFKGESNKGLVNTIVIRIHSRRHTSKGILIGLY